MLPSEYCDIPDDVCCTSLFDVAEQIRQIGIDALEECGLPTDCNDPDDDGRIASYVYHSGIVEDPVPDYYVVSLLSFGPTPSSLDQNGSIKRTPIFVARYQARLMERNWPMIETDDNGQMSVPGGELLTKMAMHSYAHGEKLYRALADAILRGKLRGCTQQTIGPLEPIPPSGGAVGWETVVTVTVDMSR